MTTPLDSLGLTPEEPLAIVASLNFSPFSHGNASFSNCTPASIVAALKTSHQTSLHNRFCEWVTSEPVLANSPLAAHGPSPAALLVLHVCTRQRAYAPLQFHLHPALPISTLRVTLPTSCLPPKPGNVVRPSEVLQTLFWHHFRILRQPADASPADVCGFSGCASACSPEPLPTRVDFHLDRVFRRHTPKSLPSRRPLSSSSSRSLLLELPPEVLIKIASELSPPDLAALSDVNPELQESLLPVIPGLALRLYPHQVHALRRMTAMEELHTSEYPVPLLERVPTPGYNASCVAVDLVDGSVVWVDGIPCVPPPVGGLFCDEPGLGKTITAISLIIKTMGKLPKPPGGRKAERITSADDECERYSYHEPNEGRFLAYGEDQLRFPDRRARLFPEEWRGRNSSRQVRMPDYYLREPSNNSLPIVEGSQMSTILLSPATLVAMPTILGGHWVHQISIHVKKGLLRVLYLKSARDLPTTAEKFAFDYDIVLASFNVLSNIYEDARNSAPVILRVHFQRVIVDEGHSLSSANVTNFTSVCQRLRAQSRWVMTGTPTPSTPRSDVDHLFSLLRFIRDESYGLHKPTWDVAVKRPYCQFKRESLERLGDLLCRVMIRADKTLLKVGCHVKNVVLDFSAPSAVSYNGLVRMVRRNLITSDWFSEKHAESLLNKKNRGLAAETLRNLKLACCFGGSMQVQFTRDDVVGTMDLLYTQHRERACIRESDRFTDPTLSLSLLEFAKLRDKGVLVDEEMQKCSDRREELIRCKEPFSSVNRPTGSTEYDVRLRQMIYTGKLHNIGEAFFRTLGECAKCREFTPLPLVTPCGHLLCDECIIADKTRCVAEGCSMAYVLDKYEVPAQLIELQPYASSEEWIKGWDDTESSKVSYLIDRIRELPKNEVRNEAQEKACLVPPKIIVHSEFGDHLKLVALKLKQTEMRDSYVEMTLNAQERHTSFAGVKSASAVAERSVRIFRTDPQINILLMNSKYGAVGLDLSFVQYIFLMEPIWDASIELQVISRAHRIGCTRDIYVERLVMRDSVEEAMLRDSKQAWRAAEIEVPGVAEAKMEKFQRRLAGILKNLKTVVSKRERLLRMSRDASVLDGEPFAEENGQVARKRAIPNADRPRKRVHFYV